MRPPFTHIYLLTWALLIAARSPSSIADHASVPREPVAISFDAHFHLLSYPAMWLELGGLHGSELRKQRNPDNKTAQVALAALAQPIADRSALISDGYLADDSTEGQELNRQTSRIAQQSGGRFVGVCGIRLDWPDAARAARVCLRLPGMRGIKLHLSWFRQSLSSADDLYTRFVALLAETRKQRPFLLIHMALPAKAGLARNRREVEKLAEAARRFPRTSFIVAHSAEHYPELLAELGDAQRTIPRIPRNIYTDISTVLDVFAIQADCAQPSGGFTCATDYAQAWRRFGIDRVLFGSDGNPQAPRHVSTVAAQVIATSALTDSEKRAILQDNGKSFLARHAR